MPCGSRLFGKIIVGGAIGTLVGVNLLMTGFSRLMVGLVARKAATGLAV